MAGPALYRQAVRPSGRGRWTVLALVMILGSAACSVGAPRLQRPDQLPPPSAPGPLKAHLLSGELVVFETWAEEVEARQLVGVGRRYDLDRRLVFESERLRVHVDSVALLEVIRSEVDPGHTVGLTLMAAYTVLTGLVTAICLSDPKACFGSCPTFYLEGGESEERLVAEGFSSSVARALEATDLDDLGWKARAGTFSIRMRNEALESHAVRSLRLHAVAEPEGRRVFATPDRRFLLAERVLEPTRCTASEGDCLDRLRTLDGQERRSWTDAADLAAREVIELEFPAARGRLGLVIGARHSFVSTFLFYQMLAYLGSEAGTFLASLERGTDGEAARIREVMDMVERLEVSVRGPDGEWRSAGAFEEAGPLATDLQLLELPQEAGLDPVQVRLDLTQGFWRVGYVALVEIGEAIESRVLTPVAVERLDGPAAAGVGTAAAYALQALTDADRYLVTQPGDHFRIAFDIPQSGERGVSEHVAYRLFLESTGYYYEWMRSEWLQEESPVHAAMMLLQPEVMFRRLAPVFKELEPRIEEAFWNSRFRR